jgi:cell division septation protein DedD
MSQQEKKEKAKKEVTVTMGAAKLLGSGLVIMFLMVWVFVLGVLTGRGDINSLFQRLGLNKTDLAARLGVASDTPVSGVLPVSQPEESAKTMADSGKKSGQDDKVKETKSVEASPATKPADPALAKAPAETSKKPGAMAPQEAKRSKGLIQPQPEHDPTLASKLSFQNSLDTPAHKQSKTAAKKEVTPNTASVAPAPSRPQTETATGTEKKTVCAYQVKVASYRTAEEAEKALADLKKKGFKVSLQQGKDKSGTTFTLKTGRYNTKSEAEKVTQKLKEAKITGQIQELKQ